MSTGSQAVPGFVKQSNGGLPCVIQTIHTPTIFSQR